MAVAEIRELLDRTGHLYTNDPQDVGHISEFWRKRILDVCAALEAAPLDVGEALRREKAAHVQTHAALAHAELEIEDLRTGITSKDAEVERALRRARDAERLIEDAMPRMRTLNNAMSPDWLRRADEFLGR